MKRISLILALLPMGIAASPALLAHPAQAQTNAIITLEQIDPTMLSGGYRASKIIGTTVVNSEGETVGTVDDLIVTSSGKVPFAVLSVGGFLGLGDTLVVVPAAAFERQGANVLLRGATKENLKRLPPFTYSE